MSMLLSLGAIAAAVWFWSDSTRARESALAACSRACRDANAQFLDYTVQLSSLRLARDVRGHLALRRRYVFEFSTDGFDRYPGQAALVGSSVEFVRLEHPKGPFIVTTGSLHVVH